MNHPDIVIIGGGMAGASLGAELAAHAHVVVLEMEDRAGYHATGRSVAFWEETYGGPVVQPLTTASGPMLSAPDPEFHDGSFLSPRGTLHIGRPGDEPLRDGFLTAFAGRVDLQPVDPATLVPGLRPGWTLGVMEASCQDIDVAALHQSYLRKLKRLGGEVRLATRLEAARREEGGWRIETRDGAIHCGLLVNAAGAWADDVAMACGVAPVGIVPLRRTVVQIDVPDLPSPDLPLIMDMQARFYFKPEGRNRIWLTPHDEEPSPPCDAAPEELAVAEAVARFEEAVDWRIGGIAHKWAGLRSFAPDRAPVYGFDPTAPGFFWFAGQGGFGIQTAPAAALLGAAMITGATPPATIASVDSRAYCPDRFR
ncbi:FAD-binding oxidoreductase [Sphingobium sp.]|uniref:NAD(P)/FAD-dependent oxidoreductase n=1 Tax=Sphingobium sp. TaxID=1912891 RepID=UPI00262D42EB|nr:FAD-binding oxidoreductase [Sphingobium sp.]